MEEIKKWLSTTFSSDSQKSFNRQLAFLSFLVATVLGFLRYYPEMIAFIGLTTALLGITAIKETVKK